MWPLAVWSWKPHWAKLFWLTVARFWKPLEIDFKVRFGELRELDCFHWSKLQKQVESTINKQFYGHWRHHWLGRLDQNFWKEDRDWMLIGPNLTQTSESRSGQRWTAKLLVSLPAILLAFLGFRLEAYPTGWLPIVLTRRERGSGKVFFSAQQRSETFPRTNDRRDQWFGISMDI